MGRLLVYELIRTAKRGVKVRVIADHMTSARNVDAAAFLATVHPNLEFRHYRPIAGRMDPSPLQGMIDGIIPNRTNQRMHNKSKCLVIEKILPAGQYIPHFYPPILRKTLFDEYFSVCEQCESAARFTLHP